MATKRHEFRVCLPSADASDVDLTNEENVAVIDEAEVRDKPPVVILLGWAGCADKHLAKYSEIYEARRFITIRHMFPTDALYFKFGKLKQIGKKVLDVIYEQELQEHPIIFHIFSNGGSMVYCHIIEFLHSSDKYRELVVKGTIIDSAPGRRRIVKATQSFMSILRVNVILKYICGFFIMIFLCLAKLFSKLFNTKTGADNPFYVHENICEDKSRWPEMFLFSIKDNIILHGDIQEVIDRRKELGVTVWSTCWEDSDHVAHFRTHREAYIQKCLDFASFSLKPKSRL